ncbi:hypothetical protein R6Q57_023503 [Mikania cordata]
MMHGLYVIILLFFTSIFSFAPTINSSSQNCILSSDWHMFITNGIPNDAIVANVRNENDSFQKCPYCRISPGAFIDWYFCPFADLFSDFTWNSTQKTL